MASEHMRRCSSSYVISQVKMKTTMRFYYIQIRTLTTPSTVRGGWGQQEALSLWCKAMRREAVEDMSTLIIFFFKVTFICLLACLLCPCMFMFTMSLHVHVYNVPACSCLQFMCGGQRRTLSFHYGRSRVY